MQKMFTRTPERHAMQVDTKQLIELLGALRPRQTAALKRGYMIVSELEFMRYAKVFGNMGDSRQVVAHNGRKSLTYNGIELRAL